MATVFYYTSTGNSLYAAKEIAGVIGGKAVKINSDIKVCDDEVIGFVAPCFWWGLPHQVIDFIKDLNITSKQPYIFAVMPCGGPGFGYLGQYLPLLKEKGLSLSYGTLLVCTSNYVPEYKIDDSEKDMIRMQKRLEEIKKELSERKIKNVRGFTAVNRAIYKAYPGKDSDRYFTVNGDCNGCQICEKICPVKNIVMSDGRPQFNHRCEHCLSCLHACPKQAIDWKNKTQGKGRYRNPYITLQELLDSENK